MPPADPLHLAFFLISLLPMNALFKALSHPVRRSIIDMLRKGPMASGDIAAAFDMSWPTITGHLNALKEAGLVSPERGRASSSSGAGAAEGREGAGQPGLARMRLCFTVSTRQAVPRDRFPHALRLAALMRAFDGSSRTPCDGRGGTDVTMPLHRHRPAPQGARRASGSHPSTSARTPGLSIARASSLDHSPPPSRNVDPTPSPSTGWAGVYGRFFLWREDWLENLRCVWKGGGMFSEPGYNSAKS